MVEHIIGFKGTSWHMFIIIMHAVVSEIIKQSFSGHSFDIKRILLLMPSHNGSCISFERRQCGMTEVEMHHVRQQYFLAESEVKIFIRTFSQQAL